MVVQKFDICVSQNVLLLPLLNVCNNYISYRMTDDKRSPALQEFKLDPDSELRFEVETKNEKVYLTLKSGFAEIFGTELVKGKLYEFSSGAKVAVFTWQGCTLELRGKPDVSYIAKETPMVIYLNCHAALEFMRNTAEQENGSGPIAMVVGPADVGKSTVCNLLLNYAVRMGRRPIFVDLDVGQGQISVPGSIGWFVKIACVVLIIQLFLGALLIERPASLSEGFSQEAPLVYHFGHKTPSYNTALYSLLLEQLASTIKSRMEVNKKSRYYLLFIFLFF